MHGREDKEARRPERRGEDALAEVPSMPANDLAPEREVFVFSRKAVRELDRLAVTEFSMPPIILMENAARGCAEAIRTKVLGRDNAAVAILCGPGNNGGDGLAIARHLHNAGLRVAVMLADPTPPGVRTPDAAANLAIVRAMRNSIIEAGPSLADDWQRVEQALGGPPDLIVDAILGTGVDRLVTGRLAEAIGWVNGLERRQNRPVVAAIDIPSGLDADTGEPAGGGAGMAIWADWTLTLAGIKEGFLTIAAQKHLGDVLLVDIGVPMELVRRLGRPLQERRHDEPPRR